MFLEAAPLQRKQRAPKQQVVQHKAQRVLVKPQVRAQVALVQIMERPLVRTTARQLRVQATTEQTRATARIIVVETRTLVRAKALDQVKAHVQVHLDRLVRAHKARVQVHLDPLALAHKAPAQAKARVLLDQAEVVRQLHLTTAAETHLLAVQRAAHHLHAAVDHQHAAAHRTAAVDHQRAAAHRAAAVDHQRAHQAAAQEAAADRAEAAVQVQVHAVAQADHAHARTKLSIS
jgi:hypothetical protein